MDLSSLLEILSPPSEAQAIQAYLSEFDTLPDTDTEKDNRRLNVANSVFPLVFGQDAAITTSPTFPQFSETTWYTRQAVHTIDASNRENHAGRPTVNSRRGLSSLHALCRMLAKP